MSTEDLTHPQLDNSGSADRAYLKSRLHFSAIQIPQSLVDLTRAYSIYATFSERVKANVRDFDMNCATLTPAITPDNYQQQHHMQLQRTLERERRTSRGLTACLRGEREEVESKFVDNFVCFSFFSRLYR